MVGCTDISLILLLTFVTDDDGKSTDRSIRVIDNQFPS